MVDRHLCLHWSERGAFCNSVTSIRPEWKRTRLGKPLLEFSCTHLRVSCRCTRCGHRPALRSSKAMTTQQMQNGEHSSMGTSVISELIRSRLIQPLSTTSWGEQCRATSAPISTDTIAFASAGPMLPTLYQSVATRHRSIAASSSGSNSSRRSRLTALWDSHRQRIP